jgi:hypothetical protein
MSSFASDVIFCIFCFAIDELKELPTLLTVHKAWNRDIAYRAVRALNFVAHIFGPAMTGPLFFPPDWFQIPSLWKTAFRRVAVGRIRSIAHVIHDISGQPYDDVHVVLGSTKHLDLSNVRSRKLTCYGWTTQKTDLHVDVKRLSLCSMQNPCLGVCAGVEVLRIFNCANFVFDISTFPNLTHLKLHNMNGDFLQTVFELVCRVKILSVPFLSPKNLAHAFRSRLIQRYGSIPLRELRCSLAFWNEVTTGECWSKLSQLEILRIRDEKEQPNVFVLRRFNKLKQLYACPDGNLAARLARVCPNVKLC